MAFDQRAVDFFGSELEVQYVGALVNFGDLITKICQSHLGGSRTQGRLQDHHLRAGKLIAWPSDAVC